MFVYIDIALNFQQFLKTFFNLLVPIKKKTSCHHHKRFLNEIKKRLASSRRKLWTKNPMRILFVVK